MHIFDAGAALTNSAILLGTAAGIYSWANGHPGTPFYWFAASLFVALVVCVLSMAFWSWLGTKFGVYHS